MYELTSLGKQTWLESNRNAVAQKYSISHLGWCFSRGLMLDLRYRKSQKSCEKDCNHITYSVEAQTSPSLQWERDKFGFDVNNWPRRQGQQGGVRTLLLCFEVKELHCGLGQQCLWEWGNVVSVCPGLWVYWVYSAESCICIPVANRFPTLIFY